MSAAAHADAANTATVRGEDTASAPPAILGDAIRIGRKRLTFVLSVTACVAVGAAVFASLIPVSYTSTAEIVLDRRTNKIADLSAVVTDAPNDPAWTQNQIRVLTSRNLAARVIEKLGLARDSELNPSGPPDTEDRIVDGFLRHLSAQPLGLSTTIAVTFASRDPRLASSVANAVADAYLEHEIEDNSKTARAATAWLTQRVGKLAIDLQNADAAVETYKREHDLSEAADGTPLIDQELLAVQGQIMDARATLAEKQATRDRLRALAASGSAPDISQVTASPVVVQLREQQADLLREEADLATRYGPKNPKIIAMESERKNIGEKIDAEIDRTVGELDSDVAVLQAQVGALQSTLKETEQRVTAENQERVELQSLEANAKSTRAAYESFVSRLRDVQGQDAMQVPDASIISRAPIPNSPSSPQRWAIVAGSVPVGFLLGLLLAMLQERGTASGAGARIVPPLRAPLIARLPDLARRGLSPFDIADSVIRHPASAFARAIASLDARIAAVRGERAKVVGISSPSSGEGKTVIAIALARAAAQRGLRVVLIDGDDISAVAWALRLGSERPGLSDVLADRTALNQCLVRDPNSGALILPRGRKKNGEWPSQPQGALTRLMDHLRKFCDLVVLDLPPAHATQSSATMAASADAVIMLLGWNGADIPGIAETNALCGAYPTRNVGLVLAG